MNLISTLFALVVVCLFLSGCRYEPEGPILAGGREIDSWILKLKDPNPQIRRQAVLKLGNVSDEDDAVEPSLAEALLDTDTLVRREAIFAVAKLPQPGEEVRQLIGRLSRDDENAEVRDVASRALQNMQRRSQ